MRKLTLSFLAVAVSMGLVLAATSASAQTYVPVAGDLIKSPSSPTVFLVDDNLARRPLSAVAFSIRYGNNWDLVKTVESSVIGNFDPTGAINDEQSHANGTLVIYTPDNPVIYLLQNGYKRPFASMQAFTSAGYSLNNLHWIGSFEIYPTGSVIQ